MRPSFLPLMTPAHLRRPRRGAATSFDGATDTFELVGPIKNAPNGVGSGIFSAWVNATPTVDFPGLFSVFGTTAGYQCGLDISDYEGVKRLGTYLTGTAGPPTEDSTHYFVLPEDFVEGRFRHILWEFDGSAVGGVAYLDDVRLEVYEPWSSETGAPFVVDYSVADVNCWMPAYPLLAGCLAEVFFQPLAAPIGITVEANRRKFITADRKRANLGPHGEYPLGYRPMVYSRDGSGTNLGTGGNFVPVGAPSVCGSIP